MIISISKRQKHGLKQILFFTGICVLFVFLVCLGLIIEKLTRTVYAKNIESIGTDIIFEWTHKGNKYTDRVPYEYDYMTCKKFDTYCKGQMYSLVTKKGHPSKLATPQSSEFKTVEFFLWFGLVLGIYFFALYCAC